MRINALRRLATALAAAAAVVSAACAAGIAAPFAAPSASAEPCPDVEVVFARGTGEPPGLGGIGGAFVEALRAQLGGRSLGVYPVNYQASSDFQNPDFPVTVIDGIRDAGSHIESMAASCPDTREVLGGYSQGAALAGYVTSAAVPKGVPPEAVPPPMPPDIAKHVAAVTLFGTPSGEFLEKYHAPSLVIGPLYQPKTLELCAAGDPICGDGGDPAAHTAYVANGMTGEAATYAAGHL